MRTGTCSRRGLRPEPFGIGRCRSRGSEPAGCAIKGCGPSVGCSVLRRSGAEIFGIAGAGRSRGFRSYSVLLRMGPYGRGYEKAPSRLAENCGFGTCSHKPYEPNEAGRRFVGQPRSVACHDTALPAAEYGCGTPYCVRFVSTISVPSIERVSRPSAFVPSTAVCVNRIAPPEPSLSPVSTIRSVSP